MTDPVRAIYYQDRDAFRRDQIPGSFWMPDNPAGEQGSIWFYCPCGCGAQARLTIGDGFKPRSYHATWCWDGNRQSPTLKPSVRQLTCGWHGWLRNGYWEAC
ncbi:MAG: DUF6527 family protein [Pelagimonas sp.]|jgi:hypothetical protein|nr:DUF6527 family protein [Pelagimonas sp.]